MRNSFEVAFRQASQSQPITLLVGENGEHATIPKELVSRQSQHLAKVIEEGQGVVDLTNQPAGAVDLFYCWCLQGRLQSLEADAPKKERMLWKRKMIQLWTFCADFAIPTLQNAAMKELLALLARPHLLNKADFKNIWDKSAVNEYGLKWLVVYTMVAQIEEGTGPLKSSIDDFQDFVSEEGFMTMAYKALQQWHANKTPKRGRTKWEVFAESEEVKSALLVSEVVPVVVKREAPEEGERPGSAKKQKSTAPVSPPELIELSDDDD